jgi:hypothetical protein
MSTVDPRKERSPELDLLRFTALSRIEWRTSTAAGRVRQGAAR